MADIALPGDLWNVDTIPEGIVSNWFYGDGAQVAAGATVAEVMAEKATYEIAVSAGGILHILTPKDGVVKPGDVIARIEAAA